jgi:hypothetical protein
MLCPVCRGELQYLNTLQMGAFEEGGYREHEMLDVGFCPVCSKRRYRNRANATFRPDGWEPTCPDCGAQAIFPEARQAGAEHGGVVFSCPAHPGRRWRWRENDRWEALPDLRATARV